MESCPVCTLRLPLHELELHVELHFLQDEEGPPPARPSAAAAASGGGSGPSSMPEPVTLLDSEDDEGQAADTDLVACPFGCGARILMADLDSHEEAHRLQEYEAQHLGLTQEEEARQFEQLQMKFGFSNKRPGKCFRCGQEGHWSPECPNNPAAQANRPRAPLPTSLAELSLAQQPDATSAQAQGVDVIPLLQACCEAQPKPRSTVYLCGPVSFFCRGAADSGWGCGYRNIQMQVSHLLHSRPGDAQALFAGAGYVPDLPSLQAWLETAWQAGFDPGGASMFGSAVQGTRKWIGTTEAAALLRYFGCRALVFDFYGAKNKPEHRQDTGATVHANVACDICGVGPIVGVRYKSYSAANFDVCGACRQLPGVQQYGPFYESGHAGGGTHPSAAGSGAAAAAGAGPTQAFGPPAWQAGPSGNDAKRQKQQQQQQQQQKQRQQQPSQQGAALKHRALAEWIWTYFSSDCYPGTRAAPSPSAATAAVGAVGAAAAGGVNGGGGRGTNSSSRVNAFDRLMQQLPQPPPSHVVVTNKPPLYLQHEGHSRTVVGIERSLPASASAPRRQQQQQELAGTSGAPRPSAAGAAAGVCADDGAEYTLLILDPGMPSNELLRSLRSKDRWQMRIKRGLHSLARHAELQLMYVAPGLVPEGPERMAMQKIAATERYGR